VAAGALRLALTHPLDGAFARVKRAGEHVSELKSLVQAFGRAYHDAILVEAKPEYPGIFNFYPPTPFRIPESISIVAGEICYNLRAALDYLIYELARFDSGAIQNNTQFPIEDRKKDFDKIVSYRLKGLNPGHITAIESLQPYSGCDWTARVKEISNPDKHRGLTHRGYAGAVWQEAIGEIRPVVDAAAANAQVRTVRRAYTDLGTEMNVQLVSSFPIHIWIKNTPVPIVETFQVLESEVADAIEAFKPDFWRH
jgi:hypothetical protein